MLDKKRRSSRDASTVHLVVALAVMSMTIYLWLLMGCPRSIRSFLCPGGPSPDFLDGGRGERSRPPRLEKEDFTKLINLRNFTFIMNNLTICNDSDPLLLVIVHSHPNNFVKRFTIRSTWGSVVGSRFKLLFLLGIPGSKRLQTTLDVENKLNNDLIQGNFVDAYRNMTYKHVMGLKWVNYFCPNARFILKTDDDVFVNSPAVLDYITKNLLPYSVKNLLLCSPIFNSRVIRSSRSKWRVTFPEYSLSVYPTYCEGFAIMYSPDVAYVLYAEAQTENYFWIDDVHVTGVLAAKANLKHSPFGSYMLSREELQNYLEGGTGNNSFLVGPLNLKEDEIIGLWGKVSLSLNDTKP